MMANTDSIWGVLKMGVPQKRWRVLGKSQSKMDGDWGYPDMSGNLHMLIGFDGIYDGI